MADDVWSPGAQGSNREGFDLGEPAYGEGIPISEAYGVRTVIEAALALTREQPALVLLAGFNVFAIGMLPNFIRMPIDLYLETMKMAGTMDDTMAQGVSAVVALALFITFLPLQQLVAAGALVSFANYVRNEDVSFGALYTSVREAVQAFFYSMIVFVITAILMTLILTPLFGTMYLALAAGADPTIIFAGGAVSMLGFIPFIYVSLGLQLGTYCVVLDDVSPVEALQISWEAASGNRLYLLLLNLVFAVLGFLAFMVTCCFFGVGTVVVQGMMMGGMSAAWMLYSRRMEETTQWDFVARNMPYL